jgi:membrane-bound serine protease (ClpP class)
MSREVHRVPQGLDRLSPGPNDTIRAFAVALIVVAAALLAGTGSFAAAADGTTSGPTVRLLAADGEVDALMSRSIREALDAAAAAGDEALVIRLDTPGGSLTSTQEIVGALLTARVPTIVWVAPPGGFAASAGTFVTLAANLAFMAPGTRIGAASPVDASGGDIPGTLGEKIRNDAVAWIRSIADVRNRPLDWAASTVFDARSSSANEAVSIGAVDGIASTLDEVLAASDGRTARVNGADVVVHVAGATVVEPAANPLARILGLLADPNVAFVLFVAGALALLFELQNPNVLTGIAGVVAIALAFVGFANLPTDLTGLLLLTMGLVLFAIEPVVPSHGLLTVGGVIAFVLGGFALYSQADQFGPAIGVAAPLVLVAVVTFAAFALLVTATALRTRHMPPPAFASSPAVPVPPGSIGQVRSPLAPVGSVYVAGEEWSARGVRDVPVGRGTPVRVVSTDGLTLIVEPDPTAVVPPVDQPSRA